MGHGLTRTGPSGDSKVRVVIAGPPKTGNMWLKCLLGRAYGLRWLRHFETPERADFQALTSWLAANRFPDGTIFHQHYDYAPEIADALDAVPAHLVTIVRDPYDAFVSTYYTVQQHVAEENPQARKSTRLGDQRPGCPLALRGLEPGSARRAETRYRRDRSDRRRPTRNRD